MRTFEIICLANSTKHGGRCIAGLKTDGSGWLRLVSTKSDGTLYPEDYMLDGDRQPEIFDILRIECTGHHPKCYQPENWVISNKKWKFVGSPNRQQLEDVLKAELERTAKLPKLLINRLDRVEYDLLEQNYASYSLALIKPEMVSWRVQEYPGKRKYRALFVFNNASYDLGITDPNWQAHLSHLPVGCYSSEEAITRLNLTDCSRDGFHLTVSMSEPFIPPGQNQFFCFKLVAAVINNTNITS